MIWIYISILMLVLVFSILYKTEQNNKVKERIEKHKNHQKYKDEIRQMEKCLVTYFYARSDIKMQIFDALNHKDYSSKSVAYSQFNKYLKFSLHIIKDKGVFLINRTDFRKYELALSDTSDAFILMYQDKIITKEFLKKYFKLLKSYYHDKDSKQEVITDHPIFDYYESLKIPIFVHPSKTK